MFDFASRVSPNYSCVQSPTSGSTFGCGQHTPCTLAAQGRWMCYNGNATEQQYNVILNQAHALNTYVWVRGHGYFLDRTPLDVPSSSTIPGNCRPEHKWAWTSDSSTGGV